MATSTITFTDREKDGMKGVEIKVSVAPDSDAETVNPEDLSPAQLTCIQTAQMMELNMQAPAEGHGDGEV